MSDQIVAKLYDDDDGGRHWEAAAPPPIETREEDLEAHARRMQTISGEWMWAVPLEQVEALRAKVQALDAATLQIVSRWLRHDPDCTRQHFRGDCSCGLARLFDEDAAPPPPVAEQRDTKPSYHDTDDPDNNPYYCGPRRPERDKEAR